MSIKSRMMLFLGFAALAGNKMSESEASMKAFSAHNSDMAYGRSVMRSGSLMAGNGSSRIKKKNKNHVSHLARRKHRRAKQGLTA